MYTSSVIARAKAALQGSETEQRIAVLLYDDTIQIISTFELNSLASLTYHESNKIILTSSKNDYIEILLNHIEQIIVTPINYSILSVQKALIVTKHLLLYGAEKIITPIQQQLGRHIDTLRQYNTVLAAQQQQSSTTSWMMRIKGGSVDTAGPVRELAELIYMWLCNVQTQLLFERNTHADPNSLVPIGNKQQVGYMSDDKRYDLLKQRIDAERTIQQKSNLQKASDGYGSGYMSANGKMVVGAAHSLEEMIQQKQKQEQQFTDDAMLAQQLKKKQQQEQAAAAAASSFADYIAPDIYNKSSTQSSLHQPQPDLLSLETPYTTTPTPVPVQPVVVDLLDLGSGSTTTPQSSLLHLNTATTTIPTNNDLLSLDPYDSGAGNIISSSITGTIDPLPPMQSVPIMNTGMMNPSMNQNVDRFAALDVLGSSNSSISGRNSIHHPTDNSPYSYNNSTTNSMMMTSMQHQPTKKDAFSDLLGTGSMKTVATPTVATPSSMMMMPQQQQQQPLQQSYYPGNTTVSSTTTAASIDYGFATVPSQPIVTSPIAVSLSSIQVSQQPVFGGGDSMNDDSNGSGFVMGGGMGSGLVPTTYAPASAPPPPPPPPSNTSFYY